MVKEYTVFKIFPIEACSQSKVGSEKQHMTIQNTDG